jgi:hypothetical protein
MHRGVDFSMKFFRRHPRIWIALAEGLLVAPLGDGFRLPQLLALAEQALGRAS